METKHGHFNRYITSTIILYIALWLLQPVPNRTEGDPAGIAVYTMIAATVIFVIYLVLHIAAYDKPIFTTAKSIISTIFAILALWILFTAKTTLLEEALFPSPEIVLRQMISDSRLPADVLCSLITLGKGYLSALVLGIFGGSVLGMSKRFGNSITYITTFLKLIPPIVYIPYAIALLPHYESVSTFVIFMSSFWPIFSSTFVGVKGVEKQYLDSAKVLNVGFFSRMINVILPASLSEIFIGCNQGLAYSFIMLTSAEMIGGSAGIGYYIKYYSNFGDFTRIIVGILVIGILISIITFLINKLEHHLLRWKPN
ncbi:MAG: ABC transporter permease subunit [Lachnospiraceae bacterium]|nr:ABC transporter permease subunit [Lachnospiraceae bacterium]